MSSPSAGKIPIRAITSPLNTRSAPSIPLAADVYDPFVKAVLRHRLVYNIFLYSAVFCIVQSSAWLLWWPDAVSHDNGSISGTVTASLLWGVAAWVLGVVPIIVMRKNYLTVDRLTSISPSETLRIALANPRTKRAWLTYTASALCIAALHAIASSSEARLGLFVTSKKHPYYLNPRLLFLLLSQLALATSATLRLTLLDRFTYMPVASSTLPLATVVLRCLSATLILPTLSAPLTIFLFLLGRVLVLPVLYSLPLVPVLIRPFTAHFLLRRNGLLALLSPSHAGLVYRAWIVGAGTLAIWECAESLFDWFVAQPITVAHTSPSSPYIPLVSAITAAASAPTVTPFTLQALAELSQLSADPSPSRAALFADTKYQPTLWAALARSSLVLLGREYQLLVRRGAPPAPAPGPSVPTKKQEEHVPGTKTSLLKDDVFKRPSAQTGSPIRALVDGLASEGNLARAVENLSSPVPLPASAEAATPSVPKLKLPMPSEMWGQVIARVRAYGGQYVPESAVILRKWYTRERVSRKVVRSVPRSVVVIDIAQTLSHLTSASLAEDAYGVVQRDIPRIMEALTGFLAEVEAYQGEITGLSSGEDGQEEDRDRAREVLAEVADVLKDSIARIVRTFGEKMRAFKFPPRVAARVQVFVDYCA